MTTQQIKWASQHDWYILKAGAGVLCHHDEAQGETMYFSCFKELYQWAGY